MKLIICENYDEVMEQAAQITIDIIKNKPDCILGLPTGSTPIGLYNNLVKEYEAGKLDFSQVKSFNLDEYYPIDPANDQSYRYFMNKHLFNRINIDINNTRVPNGNCEDPNQECAEYEKAIDLAGGIDLQILGIGNNGHIGFNEPDKNLQAYTHMTKLTENTIEANSRFFETSDDVPRKALTMGMASIMKAEKILMLITGKAKHDALMTLLSDNITTDVPASLLKLHTDVTIICDKASYEE